MEAASPGPVDALRRAFAIAVAVWLTYACVRSAVRAYEKWPDGSHERAWTTSLAERDALMLGPIRPVLEAIEAHTDPTALVLAPIRPSSTAFVDIATHNMVGRSRFLALPRIVVGVDTEVTTWRARARDAGANERIWVLDMIGVTVGDDADLVEHASGPGWRLLAVVREDGED